MGYTHYLYLNDEPTPELETIVAVALKPLIEHGEQAGILLGGSGEGRPDYTRGWFNGDRSKGLNHETFVPVNLASREYPDGYFSFCKTARKPYDIYVTAALLKMKSLLGDGIIVASDGGREDWMDGVELYEMVYDGEQAPDLATLHLHGGEDY